VSNYPRSFITISTASTSIFLSVLEVLAVTCRITLGTSSISHWQVHLFPWPCLSVPTYQALNHSQSLIGASMKVCQFLFSCLTVLACQVSDSTRNSINIPMASTDMCLFVLDRTNPSRGECLSGRDHDFNDKHV
jgi:hypothetical protein